MSLNWVMMDENSKDFIRLPREKVLFTSPPRIGFVLQSANTFPGKMPLNIKCDSGTAIVTNQRVVFLPAKPKPEFQSFQVPILALQDTHVTAPWFGPNVWEGVVLPTIGGGIPSHHNYLQIKLTFKEGGAFDFSSIYERIKDAASQAADFARENGRSVQNGQIDLEQLPAYEESAPAWSSTTQPAPAPAAGPEPFTATSDITSGDVRRPTAINPRRPSEGLTPRSTEGTPTAAETTQPAQMALLPPDEPPPSYDEVPDNGPGTVNALETSVRNSERHSEAP